ncbi:MAG: hypothetical protein ACHQ7M_06820, partial [Chloroflexota bacterium]
MPDIRSWKIAAPLVLGDGFRLAGAAAGTLALVPPLAFGDGFRLAGAAAEALAFVAPPALGDGFRLAGAAAGAELAGAELAADPEQAVETRVAPASTSPRRLNALI